MDIRKIELTVRLLAIVVLLALAWVCLGGDTLLVVQTPTSGFLVHMLVFFFLGALGYVGWVEAPSIVTIVLLMLAMSLEAAQVGLQARSFSIIDLAGNLIGVGLAWAFYRVLVSFKRTIRV